jgi:hypothetical protein
MELRKALSLLAVLARLTVEARAALKRLEG